MDNLFSMNTSGKSYAPLAERMRPETLDEFYGQQHILSKGMPLERAIRADRVTSMIFWGPPGCGKTTLANIISKTCGGEFAKLNAVSCGVADVKEVIKQAKDRMNMYGKRTYLLLDECHRFNKAQLDSLLASIEDGSIVFIGSTTENPNVALTRAILSRCIVYEFKKLTKEDLNQAKAYADTLRIARIGETGVLPNYSEDMFIQEMRREFPGEGQMFFMYKRRNHDIVQDAASGGTVPASNNIFTLLIPDAEIENGNVEQ